MCISPAVTTEGLRIVAGLNETRGVYEIDKQRVASHIFARARA